MTSPKYSADKFAAKNDLKRSFGKLIVPSIVSFLFSFYIFVINTYSTINLEYSDTAEGFVSSATSRYRFVLFSSTMFGYIIIPIIMIVVGVLFAFASYYQLMRKNCVNFFFSSPVDRKTYFKNRVLASVSLMAVTAFVPVLCDVIINIHYFSHADVILYQGLLLFLEHFVNMLIGFSLMSISMMACYTITESLIFGAGVIWFPTLIIFSINYVAEIFLRGYEQSIGFLRSSDYSAYNTLLNKLSLVNPVFFGRKLGESRLYNNIYYACYRPVKEEYSLIVSDSNSGVHDYSKSGMDYVLPILIWLALSVIFILIAEKLILNRKLENTALHASRPFINSFVAFEASFFIIGFLILAGNDIEVLAKSKFAMVLTALLGGFVVYFVLISISRRSVKHNFKLLAPGVASVLICTAVIVICHTDAFGYATYVPDYEKVSYASVTSNYLDASGVMSNNSFYENSAFDGLTLEGETNTFIGKFTTKEGIDEISKIQKSAYEKEVKDSDYTPTVTVFYHLKSGQEVSRVFYNTDISVQNEILNLTETKEYKDELEFLLSSKRADEKVSGKYDNSRSFETSYFSSFDIESDVKYALQNARTFVISKDAFTKTEIENTPALRDAILKDIETVGYKELFSFKHSPIGAINFKYDDTVNNYKGTVYASDNTFYIYDSMTSTIAYLKSVGKLEALSDTSSLGSLKCVYVAKAKEVMSFDADVSLTTSRFESRNINTKTYLDSTGEEFSEKNLLSVYFRKEKEKVIKNEKTAKKLFDTSSIYSKINNDSYILLFKFDNGVYLSRYLSKEDAQKYLK